MLRVLCPKCGGTDTRKICRLGFFFRMSACLGVVALGYLSLIEIDELEPPANFIALIIICFSVVFVPFCVNYLIRTILIKKTSYLCRTCKNAFQEGFKTRDFPLNGGLLVRSIRKRN